MSNLLVNIIVYGMMAAIPAIIAAAFYFNNGNILWGLAIPVIFFMAG